MGTLGDVKDILTLGALGAVAYLVYSLIKDPAAPFRHIIETTKEVTQDIVERRETFGIPGSLNPPGFEGGDVLTPGWLGLPPSGSAGMMVYADKFAEYFSNSPTTVNSNDAGGGGVR